MARNIFPKNHFIFLKEKIILQKIYFHLSENIFNWDPGIEKIFSE